MKRTSIAVSVLLPILFTVLVGCQRIVKTMEDAGSGDVAKVSDVGMVSWLDEHKTVLLAVKQQCIDVRASGPPASWAGHN
jgi:hypothetical protein